jgi:transcriptional repressor NrdR
MGLKRSLEKRPYTEMELQTIMHNIERDVQKVRGGEITSLQIGDIVMKHLKAFDKVAYIRFASVYLSFKDVNMFEKELKSLKKTK